jgi:hypothetical protein
VEGDHEEEGDKGNVVSDLETGKGTRVDS